MDWIDQTLQQMEERGLRRSLRQLRGGQARKVELHGREVLLFCSNNYLGLANHPRLVRAGQRALEEYGSGSGASRLISGNMELHEALESEAARFKQTEATLLFNSGYHANIGLLTALTDRDDQIFSDELNHASLIDGCRLSRARTFIYQHRDPDHLEDLLQKEQGSGRRFIVTDGLFSMDGDIAPLPDLIELGRRYNATVILDDAHGTGVLGATGRGTVEHFGVDRHELIEMATFGKAFGVFGAFVSCTKTLRELLINKARSFIYTTALPPALCAMAIEAIRIVSEEPEHLQKLQHNIEYFRHRLSSSIPRDCLATTTPRTPIFPILIGDADQTMEICETLLHHGIYAQGIRPPTVPPGRSRLRWTLMASHTREDLDTALKALSMTLNEALTQPAQNNERRVKTA